jgi:hypothetical protein
VIVTVTDLFCQRSAGGTHARYYMAPLRIAEIHDQLQMLDGVKSHSQGGCSVVSPACDDSPGRLENSRQESAAPTARPPAR